MTGYRSDFHYYHPMQKGSTSLKRVLPAITGSGYEDLDINDGQTASLAFQTATYSDVPEEVGDKVRTDLEKYCGRDTEGMGWINEDIMARYWEGGSDQTTKGVS